MKYEIAFFASDLRKHSNAHTYQCEAETLIDALAKWAGDWPNGCAYAAREGWHMEGHGVVSHDVNKPEPEVKEVVLELTPKERREQMRRNKTSSGTVQIKVDEPESGR